MKTRGSRPFSPWQHPIWRKAAVLLGIGAASLAAPLAARAQDTASVATLYAFTAGSGLFYPNSLLRGSDGNFYGTTLSGTGTYYGTVFRLTPDGTLTILHSFASGDGIFPNPGLIQGSDGNLYGTTAQDGRYYGMVFQVSPAGGFKLLHSFSSDGGGTRAGVVQGRNGNLYGVTDNGQIYRVSTAGSAFTVLASRPNAISSSLDLGSDGNFYGTDTSGGVTASASTFFRVTPSGAVTVLGAFPSGDSAGVSPLVEGRDGNFYGTAATNGDVSAAGSVFRFSPAGAYTVLHRFSGGNYALDGARLTQGSDGNFYGTTQQSGSYNDGTVFRITRNGDFTSLYNFDAKDGSVPSASGSASIRGAALLQGDNGDFYGTTSSGGAHGAGTVFQLTVQPDFFAGASALAGNVYYLQFPASGKVFGYYTFLSEPHFLYHYDLGFEYVIDAADGQGGVYLYDFTSGDFFYTGPTFPFPYLYDFGLQAFLYYYPDPTNPQRYNTNGVRYFYNFSAGKVISK